MFKTYKRKDLPGIDTLLKRVAPKNRKHSVTIITTNGVTPHDTCWDGGTRYSYLSCTLDGRNVSSVPAPTAPPQFGGAVAREFAIVPGRAVVKLGTFCGKTATPTVFVHPDDKIQLGLVPVCTHEWEGPAEDYDRVYCVHCGADGDS